MRNLNAAIRRMGSDEAEFLSNRSLIANAIVGQMLPDAVVKGGSSLKIRFGDAFSRATTDLDAARSVSKDEFANAFAQLHITHKLLRCSAAHWYIVPPFADVYFRALLA